jgi:FkbM family methyltransferase
MGANSPLRKLVKKLLYPLLNERVYQVIQAVSMAQDIRTGSFRETELEVLPYAARAGENVLDIGANYGLYAHHLSKVVGPHGHVYAFEPVPFTAGTLRIVAALLRFRGVEVIEKGLSDQNGPVTFTLPTQESGAIAAGMAHIAGRDDQQGANAAFRGRYAGTREVTCQVVRLDDFLPASTQVSFIKMDIEGAELQALRGGEQVIDRCKPSVLIEINSGFLAGFGVKLDDLLQFFSGRGYRMFWWDDKQRRLVAPTLGEKVDDNFFFIHPDRLDRFAGLLS